MGDRVICGGTGVIRVGAGSGRIHREDVKDAKFGRRGIGDRVRGSDKKCAGGTFFVGRGVGRRQIEVFVGECLVGLERDREIEDGWESNRK